MTQHRRRRGGQVLVDQLLAQGVERLTCVPGESYLAVLDALHDGGIRRLTCRNEGGAAMMAEAYGKLTGRPGICFVTRGPGATNASHGVHIAAQDSTPMILFIGQVARDMREREAFQEVDYKLYLRRHGEVGGRGRQRGPLSRADRSRLPCGNAGPSGAGRVSLPEDMLLDEVEVGDAPRVEPAEIWPAPAQMAELQRLLEEAHRPLAILGGSRWTRPPAPSSPPGVERWALPVATSFRRAGPFRQPITRTMPATLASARTRSWRPGSRRPICFSSSAAACRRCPHPPTRCSTFPCRRSAWCMSIRERRSWAGSTCPRSPSRLRPLPSARACAR